MGKTRICSVEGCNKPYLANGYCQMHYSRVLRTGSIELPEGKTRPGAVKAFLDNAIQHRGEECLIWPYCRNANGYALINQDGRSRLAHRIICQAVHGKPPTPKHGALHRCGRGGDGCVNPEHLYWGTHQENMLDRNAHGTSNRGARQWMSKLTEEQVREIRALRGQLSQEKIGRLYGVSDCAVYAIHAGKNWSWLKD